MWQVLGSVGVLLVIIGLGLLAVYRSVLWLRYRIKMQQAFANRATSGTRGQPVYDPFNRCGTPAGSDADSAQCYTGPSPLVDGSSCGGSASSVSPSATTPLAPAAAAIVADARSTWRHASSSRSALLE